MDLYEFLNHLNSGKPVLGGSPEHAFMHAVSQEAMAITNELNSAYHTPPQIRALFAKLIGKEVSETFGMFPPFYTDCGKNISIGENVFINSGCRFQDQGGISIGNGALIGHNVVLATLNHHPDPKRRSTMLPAPITIGENVWIGANATILPGVTIGDGAIIAAGAVVTKNVDSNTIVAGVPARFLNYVNKNAIN